MNNSVVRKHRITPLNVSNVIRLIEGQAAIHKTEFSGDVNTFQDDLSIDQGRIGTRVPLIHGYFFTPESSFGPIGYTFFYPMFNRNGELGFWGEDTFVDQRYRRSGIGSEIIRERVQMMFDAAHAVYRSYPPHFLDWLTAENNDTYHKFAQRLYGISDSRDSLEVVDASKILNDMNANESISRGQFRSKIIGIRDAYVLDKMNQNLMEKDRINPEFAGQAPHFPLLGFVVTRENNDVPIAALVTNTRYSTFRTHWDLAAQPVVFSPALTHDEKIQVMHSLFEAIHAFRIKAAAQKTLNCGEAHLSILLKKETPDFDLLKNRFNLERLAFSDGQEKLAVPYRANLDVLERQFGEQVRFVAA